MKNSVIVAIASTILATVLGTVAALGLSSRYMPYKDVVMAILISPMIVPLIISAAAMFFFFSRFQLTQTYIGVILAHTALGIPFVVITVTATLSGFDHSLTRASASLGANPVQTFFKVVLPLVTPGVISGACLHLSLHSMKWWWCCLSPAQSKRRCQYKCGLGYVKRSAPPYLLRQPCWWCSRLPYLQLSNTCVGAAQKCAVSKTDPTPLLCSTAKVFLLSFCHCCFPCFCHLSPRHLS